jgi:hypothetical protein
MKSANLTKFENIISNMSADELNAAVSIFNATQKQHRRQRTSAAKKKFTVGSKVYLNGHESDGVFTVVDMRRTKCSVQNDTNGMRYSCSISILVAA